MKITTNQSLVKTALQTAPLFFVLAFLLSSSLSRADEKPGAATPEVAPPAESSAPAVAKPAAPVAPVFTGTALTIKNQLDELFAYSKKVNSVTPDEKKKARHQIETSLDWDNIAQDCLGPAQWKKQPAKNKADFQKLLREVISKTAYTRLDKFWGDATYAFDKIEVTGKKALVASKFIPKTGDALVLEYYLHEKGGRWLIYDIAFEGVRYSANINEQLDAFLKEKSFPGLLEKLRKRRDDIDSGKTKKA